MFEVLKSPVDFFSEILLGQKETPDKGNCCGGTKE